MNQTLTLLLLVRFYILVQPLLGHFGCLAYISLVGTDLLLLPFVLFLESC